MKVYFTTLCDLGRTYAKLPAEEKKEPRRVQAARSKAAAWEVQYQPVQKTAMETWSSLARL